MSRWTLYAIGMVSFLVTLAALVTLWLMATEKSPARAGLFSREVAERQSR
jgi:bacteriorhodopsin